MLAAEILGGGRVAIRIEDKTPDVIAELYQALPDPDTKLLVETAIESGLRWGELAELRAGALEFSSRMLTVSRTAVEVHPQFHPQGGRFLVKEYPKDREYRRLKLSAQITAKLKSHGTDHQLGRNDLLFRAPADDGPRRRKPRLVADSDSLGRTEPSAKGRRYRSCTCTRCPMPTKPRSKPWPRSGIVRSQAEDASAGRTEILAVCASRMRADRSISCTYSSISSRSRAWSSHFWPCPAAVQSRHGAITRARR